MAAQSGSPLVGNHDGEQVGLGDDAGNAAEVLAPVRRAPHESRVISAHRTPDLASEYSKSAESRGIEVLIAGGGGARRTWRAWWRALSVLPVLGVPVQSKALNGLDSLLLDGAKCPGGIPVGTLAIGEAGAKNAGLLAIRILATTRPDLRQKTAFVPMPKMAEKVKARVAAVRLQDGEDGEKERTESVLRIGSCSKRETP